MERKLRAGPLVGLVLVVGLILAAARPASAQGPAWRAVCDGISALADEGVAIGCPSDEGCPGAFACVRDEVECRPCGEHGLCQLGDGECVCEDGWGGDNCTVPAAAEFDPAGG